MKKYSKAISFLLALAIIFSVAQFGIIASALSPNLLAGVRYDEVVWNDADFEQNPFGTAKYYNGFILKNLENIIDSEGAVAVAGNFSTNRGFSISSQFSGNTTSNFTTFNATLLVGGNITGGNGQFNVHGGQIVTSENSKVVNGNGTTVQFKKPSGTDETNELKNIYNYYKAHTSDPIYDNGDHFYSKSIPYMTDKQIHGDSTVVSKFFSSADAALKSQSVALAAKPQTTGASISYSGDNITFNCVSNQNNVFTLDLRDTSTEAMKALKQNDAMNITIKGILKFNNLGSGTALVNILVKPDATINTSAGSWGEMDQLGKLMFNIPESSKMVHTSKSIHGSLLAPNMKFTATSGGCIYGNIVLESVEVQNNGGFEFHNFGFNGFPQDKPTIPSDPYILGWMRSTEIKDASFLRDVVSGKDAWSFDQAFANTPLKYFENEDVRKKANEKAAANTETATPSGEQFVGEQHIWDRGTYFDKYKIQNNDVPYAWASWSHHGISGNTTDKGQYSIRRIAAYIEYTQAQLDAANGIYIAPKDELGNRSYLFPINDNAFIFVNGKLAYWGGTDTIDGNNQFGALNREKFLGKNGIKVTSGINDVFKNIYPHTDGWCIDLEENKAEVNIKSLMTPGFNRIDIVTDEYWEGGGMNRLYLFNE